MDDDDLGYPEESSAWLSSSDSESEHDESCTGIAMTPYSRITAHHRQPFSIARKTLFSGHRPPHDPDRELAIHKLLSETLKETKSVIPLLAYEVSPNGRIKLDFPLMQTDLKELYRWKKEEIAKEGTIIERFLEILEALEWVHGLGIIHRDVNPSNILLSNDLKEPAFLADFGISWMEEYPDDPDEGIIKYSSGVGTGPYRAPELIFAPKDYAGEVDIWSFGCTVAELYSPKDTVFSDGAEDGGLSSDLVLLGSIISTLGTPTSETWPETKTFRDWDKIQLGMKPALPRETVVPWAPQRLIPWIFSMIAISAGERVSATTALEQGREIVSKSAQLKTDSEVTTNDDIRAKLIS